MGQILEAKFGDDTSFSDTSLFSLEVLFTSKLRLAGETSSQYLSIITDYNLSSRKSEKKKKNWYSIVNFQIMQWLFWECSNKFLQSFIYPSGYHLCTTSFNEALTQVLRRFKSCSWRVGDLRWWISDNGLSWK